MKLRHSYYQDPEARCALGALAKEIFGLDLDAGSRLKPLGTDYTPFSFFDEGHAVANVSASLMRLMIEGERVNAVQIGTVASLPERRKQGLIRELMSYAHKHWERECSCFFLFANQTTIGFYEQFGYRAVAEHGFRVSAPEWAPPRVAATLLSLDEPAHCQLIRRLANARAPVSRVLGVVDHAWLLAFHLAGGDHLRLHYVREEDCLVASTLQGQTVTIVDVVGARIPTLASIYGHIGAPQVDAIELSFTPDLLAAETPAAEPLPPELFVRGRWPLPQRAFRFPTTAKA